VVVDELTIDADTITATDDFIIDAVGDITLDADGGDIFFKDAGTTIAEFTNNDSDFELKVAVQDKDIRFRGNDGGVAINALKLDMSDGGAATLNNGLTLTDGNLVVASGHGIDFSATANNTAQSSSMASELLDDYEEGTWTPSYSVTSSVGNLGYYSPQGSYIKIGNQVTVWFYMSAHESNASGNFRVNLPFTSQNVSNYFAVASLTGTGWAGIGDAQEIHGRLSANATIINLNIVGNMNEVGAVTQANTDTSFILYGTITYKTA
jgi:hypothetical protein